MPASRYLDDAHIGQRRGTRTIEHVNVGATFYHRCGKRAVDVTLASLFILAMSPLYILIVLALRVSVGSGVLFEQRRVGRHSQDFTLYKFRTMKHSRRRAQVEFEGHDRRSTHKAAGDPRHTSIGRVLRKTSLDELPQMFNVLKGEMSLVGPRPELSAVVDRYDLRSHPRHAALPGVTGAWQVGARNTGVLLHECVDDDVDYVDGITFRRDVRILASTVRTLARPAGT